MSGDMGFMLSLPTDSIAVRVVCASIVAVVLGRLILRAGLRVARVRAAVALLPGFAVIGICVAFAGAPSLPSLWRSVDATGGLTIPVRDTYLSLAPATVPVVIGLWASIALARLLVRGRRVRRVRRSLEDLAMLGHAAPMQVLATVTRIASALRVTPPSVVVVPALSGGAVVVGIRRPMLLVEAGLLHALDPYELEGVLAHELAHIVRRDNLVAAALGVLRDVLFFVPGGSWSLTQLLRERELAADTTAVAVTDRPGALASGLLKVIEAANGRQIVACAPLLHEGTLVSRVEALCDERPPPSRSRRSMEALMGLTALLAAIVAAATLPSVAAGAERQRDALGVLISDVAQPASDASFGSARSAVFRAYDATSDGDGAREPSVDAAPLSTTLLALDDPEAFTPVTLDACAGYRAACGTPSVDARVSMTPRPIIRVSDAVVDQWRLEPVVRSADQEYGMFWFQRLPTGG
ncbi:MAG: Zn-dependent protease with chaperone function [Nitriliruptoraceae bacterium]|jgi:Zn-dependent protease with chaperone function